MSSEYQIPIGDHHPQNQEDSVRAELTDIYRRVDETDQRERSAGHISEKLHFIGKSIAAARKYKLDSILLKKTEGRVRFISSASRLLFGREISKLHLEEMTEADLMNQEAAICSDIFENRTLPDHLEANLSFFNYDPMRWFLHDRVTDKQTKASAEVTFHYEVHPHGVLRIVSHSDRPNEIISGEELDNFVAATHRYHEKVMSELYSTDQTDHRKAS